MDQKEAQLNLMILMWLEEAKQIQKQIIGSYARHGVSKRSK